MNSAKHRLLAGLVKNTYFNKVKRSSSVINSDTSSMGDVAFLLLIFFIVTTSFILRQGIFMTLPSKSEGPQQVEDNLLMKIYPQNSGYMYNQQKISKEDLVKQMKIRLAEKKDLIVLIFMAEEVPYSRLIDTLSIVKENGIQRVSVKAVKEETS